ncbi:hypothetical protein BCL57_000199 [Agromyces flavus]|uniref:Uncharacterized protein n=1 Tax=Agromyces flavus TaxID=589382 RepID=A0A1H1W268_9MICO|nr:hypothetical protein [Agromyces flavus]MCP2366057.1 hypothetical protein [Agromyces flavus]GGI43913.1 hypothetical protein GCM10010932_01970 [Agromyces flavus]SDS90606.1 hypothetical protein SAMN04489721_2129 [Agromyces flavus]
MSEALSNAHDAGAHPPIAEDHPAFELRGRATETLVLVASVVVLRLVGVLLLLVSSYEFGSFDALLPLLALVADPNLLVWIGLTAAVQLGLRGMRRSGRWALILLAVPVAVFLVSLVRGIPNLASAGIVGILGNAVGWIDAGILMAVVALGLVFTAAFVSHERQRSASIAGGLLAVGGLLTLVLLWQAFETYFTLFGSQPVVTPADEDRYVVTAALTLGALVGAIVFAAISRRRALIVTACIVGCLGVVVALAVPVPADRFIPPPPPAPGDDGGGGGGSCYGPGDPNCVGG